MSRFLEYGVFVPAKSNEKSAAPTAFQWARVGAKWMKVGPDGQPLVPTPTAASSRPPRDDENEEVRVDPLSRTSDSTSSSKTEEQSSSSCRTGADPEAGGLTDGTGLPSSGSCATTSSWDRETPPPTSDEETGTPPRPNNDRSRALFGRVAGGGEESCSSGEASRGLEEREGAGGGRIVAGGGGGSSTGGLTVDANGDEQSARGDQVPRNPSRESMLTPGVSRTYSKDDVVGKFFGEGALANGGELYSSGSSAACVGERAPPRDGDGGASRRKGKPPRTSGGVGVSPRRPSEPAKVVETRDVACQWDGSEMGDASDDENDIPPLELPDTPDCNALTAVLRLYDHAKQENKRTGVLTSRSGWGVDENIENWDGVYLDTEERVVALDVDGDPENRQAVLIGPLPVELAGMDHLEQLTLRRHRFKGRIPAEFGKLTRLTHLNLSNCRLVGFIPPEFGELANLNVLNLSWNFLSGDLAPELGKLSNLEELLVNSNAFSGPIPPEFGKLRKLQRFNAGHNIGLSGALPPEISRMSQLALLDLRHNKISGRIPPLFGRLTNLQQLWLQDNQLTDDIPAELARLPKLQMLHLANNRLSGAIPMALRGHPRYRAFKILGGNLALGERVAPTEKEVEAASRRMPSKNAMAHASGAHASSMQQAKVQQQQRRDSQSLSPLLDGAGRRSNRSDSSGNQRPVSLTHSLAGTLQRTLSGGIRPGTETPPMDDTSKRRSAGRNSMGRRLRGMKRIMGKKVTPPTSPYRQRDRSGTEDSARSMSPPPSTVGIGHRVTSSGLSGSVGGFSPRSELTVEGSEADSRTAHGKAFLEEGDGEEGGTGSGGEGGGGDGEANESPNPTASLSTGNGASSHASPSSD